MTPNPAVYTPTTSAQRTEAASTIESDGTQPDCPPTLAETFPPASNNPSDLAACGSAWQSVEGVLHKHYTNPDTEAARVLCAAMASHSLKQFPPAWCLVIAPPGSAKTDLLESFRGLRGVHFVDELTTNTFLSGKVDDKGKKRTKPASLLHRIGNDGVIVAADFSTFTSDPKTLKIILAQFRRIYDGNYCREFGTDEHLEEREWKGRLTFFGGAVPDIDRHYSLFQSLGERFIRTRSERAGGVETGLQAMEHTSTVQEELREAVHTLLRPILLNPQTAPSIPNDIKLRIANLGEFIALSRSHVERDAKTREAIGIPTSEGNTRLPQQLSQLARGSALLDGRSEVNQADYKLTCRAAFDSLPPARIAVLNGIIQNKSPFTLGLPKATVSRALEDLELCGILVKGGLDSQVGGVTDESLRVLSETATKLLEGAAIRGQEPMADGSRFSP